MSQGSSNHHQRAVLSWLMLWTTVNYTVLTVLHLRIVPVKNRRQGSSFTASQPPSIEDYQLPALPGCPVASEKYTEG